MKQRSSASLTFKEKIELVRILDRLSVDVIETDEIRKIKAENPELYTITLTTESCADVTITPDNKLGGELAARPA